MSSEKNNIFVINSGSSSIKYQLISMPDETLICSGVVERIGMEDAIITHKIFHGDKKEVFKETLPIKDHAKGLEEVAKLLTAADKGVIANPEDIKIVGHRVLHGGDVFTKTTVVTEEVKNQIQKLFVLGPLHNPANYTGICVAEKIFSKATQIAVFDTAFHQTMPAKAYRYAIPNKFYTENHIRVYGFHGTSHKYISEKALEYLENPKAKLITIHLGNGCSMAAVKDGKCQDTTMGLGPLDGLVMGTRAGNIDATVVFYLANQLGYDIKEIDTLFNKKSGMLGLTGYSDMRDIESEMEKGNEDAILGMDIYCYRIKKAIGAYIAALNGADALVFAGGVGENDDIARSLSLKDMSGLGILLDEEKNKKTVRMKGIHEIQASNSKAKILVITTDEELEIAKQCYELVYSK